MVTLIEAFSGVSGNAVPCSGVCSGVSAAGGIPVVYLGGGYGCVWWVPVVVACGGVLVSGWSH